MSILHGDVGVCLQKPESGPECVDADADGEVADVGVAVDTDVGRRFDAECGLADRRNVVLPRGLAREQRRRILDGTQGARVGPEDHAEPGPPVDRGRLVKDSGECCKRCSRLVRPRPGPGESERPRRPDQDIFRRRGLGSGAWVDDLDPGVDPVREQVSCRRCGRPVCRAGLVQEEMG